MSIKKIQELIKKHKIQIVDLKFTDFFGTWQHFSIPVSEVNETLFKEGTGFDGSSIRRWQMIDESDMLVVPDPATAIVDPFTAAPTLSMVADIQDPLTGKPYSRDPRYVAKKAEEYLRKTKIADAASFGPEAEFFIFDGIRYDQKANAGYYFIDSDEGIWNSGKDFPNTGHRPRHKEGYFPTPPTDFYQDIRSEMALELEKAGVAVEKHHHEVSTAGQSEIGMRFDSLTKMADKIMLYKYIVKNVAKRHGKAATFMPKPIFEDNGSGMHVHQSLWKNGKPLFAGNEYSGVSKMCLYYIGGILKHAHAIAAFTNPTTNSYKRLVPGYEAPVNLAHSSRNRSSGVRIPMYSRKPAQKRIEVRFPDPACNPYFGFAAMLMAGLDGIQNKIEPPVAMDKDLYDLSPSERAKIPQMPGSLEEALSALEKDNKFLLRGGVFTEDVFESWISYKRKTEVDAIRMRPHPYEFHLYFDV